MGFFREGANTQQPKIFLTVCFDGAAQGNPGKAGCGAILFAGLRADSLSPASTSQIHIGTDTNNKAEAFAFTLAFNLVADFMAMMAWGLDPVSLRARCPTTT